MLDHDPMFRLSLILATVLISASISSASASVENSRSLKFYHTHTGEVLDVTYSIDGRYQPGELKRVNRFLADWRNGKAREMDARLLDILWQIQQVTGNSGRYEVISGYRSPETNALLRSRSSGVAAKSQHMDGKAIDVRLRGLDTKLLRDTALALKKGGVGYYQESDFVHIDTGRVRSW